MTPERQSGKLERHYKDTKTTLDGHQAETAGHKKQRKKL